MDALAVDEALERIDVVAVMRGAFAALGQGLAAQPRQTLTPLPGGGDFITYLGMLEPAGVFGAKLSPYLPGADGATITAWTLLMSCVSGQPLLLCDAKRLTTERTAATTVLAADCLAPHDATTLCVVGAGAVGLAHLRLAQTVRPWKSLRLCSPSIAHRPEAGAAAAADGRIALFDDVDEAVKGADVVMLCTSSASPVLRLTDLDRAALITSISTNAANAHEIDASALPHMDVYCDDRRTTPEIAGEMVMAAAAGWSPAAICADLPELVCGHAAPPSGERHTFFRSMGLGLEDIAVAAALLAAVEGAGVSPADPLGAASFIAPPLFKGSP